MRKFITVIIPLLLLSLSCAKPFVLPCKELNYGIVTIDNNTDLSRNIGYCRIDLVTEDCIVGTSRTLYVLAKTVGTLRLAPAEYYVLVPYRAGAAGMYIRTYKATIQECKTITLILNEKEMK